MNEQIIVMGSEWHIVQRNEQEDERLSENLGYCDEYSRFIVISDLKEESKDRMAIDNMDALKKKVIRHEIIHAFLSECGLRECSEWAQNEEMVDWIAIQFPRLCRIFNQLECLK